MILSLLLVLIIVSLTYLAYIYHEKDRKYLQKIANFPSPRRLPILGHALEFGTNSVDNLRSLERLIGTHGSTFHIFLGPVRAIIATADPDIFAFVLTSQKTLEKSLDYRFMKPWLGTGLLTSGEIKWKRQRKIITPAFHFKILEEFVETMERNSQIMIDLMQKELKGNNNHSIDIYPYITLCALDIICETAMGTQINAQKDLNSEYVKAIKSMGQILMRRTFSAWKQFDALYRFSQDFKEQKQCLQIIHDFTKKVIESRKVELTARKPSVRKNIDDIGVKRKTAFLDLLIDYSNNGQSMTDEDIREEVDTFMFEGHDTTASGLSFALYELSRNAEVQEKCMAEIVAILGTDPSIPANYANLQEMKYLDMVIKETLRLYPSVPIFGREMTEDLKCGKYNLCKSTTVAMMPYFLHRNPKLFPNPEKFDPERFTIENQVGRHPYAYVPFSAGSRNCIGQKFAILEMKSTISSVLRNFELLDSKHKLLLGSEAVLKSANGVMINLKPRKY